MIKLITQLDFSVLHAIQSAFKCAVLDFLMPKITFLGNGGLIWLLWAAVLIITPKYRRAGILVVSGLLLGVLIGNAALKHLFARPRPCWLDGTVQMLIQIPRDYSFPSGHTLSSVIAAFILTDADSRFGIAAIPLAALIAFSRLYLFVHFPTNVLFSVIIGIAVGFAVWKAGGGITDKIPGLHRI